MNRSIIVACCVVALFGVASGQSPEQSAKFRLGQSYEQAGDFENASRLYRQLYSSDSANHTYFEGLRRTLIQLKHYDEVESLIRHRMVHYPSDFNLQGLLASVYYKAGKEQEAFSQWDKALTIEPANANAYRVVAAMMMENRLLDKAAETYRLARVRCNDPNLFTLDLAQILVTSLNYREATSEYIRWLKANPNQLGNIQSRMTVLSGKEDGRSAAIQVLKEEMQSDDRLPMQRLLAWLYLEGKDYGDAYTVYRRIDQLANAKGGEIQSFADRALKDGAYASAAQAYKAAMDIPVNAMLLPYAKIGHASALKELSIRSDSSAGPAQFVVPSETQTRYAEVIASFRRIITEYPRSEFSARSYYQIATLQYERMFDLDAALASFTSAEGEIPNAGGMRYDIALRIGDVLTAAGDTARAALRYRSAMSAAGATPDQQDEATYRLAELEFFGGRFQQALTLLNSIVVNLNADYANDALQLLSFLQENTATAEPALREFGRAAFLARQRKNSEAIEVLRPVVERNRQASLADDALLTIASLQTQMHQFGEAITTYRKLIEEFKESCGTCDRAQYAIAEVYQYGTKEKEKAVEAYEKLLSDYPHSLLVTSARKRVRELRGDTL